MLSTSLNRKDELPNIHLAEIIVQKNDQSAVKELVDHLPANNKNIQSDCIKVLYEIGQRNPNLINGYIKKFIDLLNHGNNRLIWGGEQ